MIHGLLALAILLISCDLTTLATPTIPSPVPGAVETIIAQTADAAARQTAVHAPPTVTPTFTPVPTKTPSATPSPSPTPFLFLLATFTRTPSIPTFESGSGDYACALTAQTPEDDSSVAKGQTFAVSWTVQNTGRSTWDSNNTDFIYVSGTKLTSLEAADLPQSVAPGGSTILKLTMEAPNHADTYRTVWTLRAGKTSFCRLTLSIVVQ